MFGQNYQHLFPGADANDKLHWVEQFGVAHVSGNRIENIRGTKSNHHPVGTHYNTGLVMRNNLLRNHRTTASDAEPVYVKSQYFVIDKNRILDTAGEPDRGANDGVVAIKVGVGTITNNIIRHGSDGRANMGIYQTGWVTDFENNTIEGFRTCNHQVQTAQWLAQNRFRNGIFRMQYGRELESIALDRARNTQMLLNETYRCDQAVAILRGGQVMEIRDSDFTGSDRVYTTSGSWEWRTDHPENIRLINTSTP